MARNMCYFFIVQNKYIYSILLRGYRLVTIGAGI